VRPQGKALDAKRLRSLLRGESFVRRLHLLGRVSSTNDRVRELAAEGAPAGTVVLAEQQTAGRGRLGRTWYSAEGLGLFVSVLLRPEGPVSELTRWTLGAAVAACEACRQIGGAEVSISWPNDLIWEGRKLGGVLAEMRSVAGSASDLVVGTGLNVGHGAADFPDELSSIATSLRLAAGGEAPERELLAAVYLREFGSVAATLGRDGWSGVAQHWERLAPGARGRRVGVVDRSGDGASYEGVTAGLDEVGGLRVRRGDGRVTSVRLVESVLPMEA